MTQIINIEVWAMPFVEMLDVHCMVMMIQNEQIINACDVMIEPLNADDALRSWSKQTQSPRYPMSLSVAPQMQLRNDKAQIHKKFEHSPASSEKYVIL